MMRRMLLKGSVGADRFAPKRSKTNWGQMALAAGVGAALIGGVWAVAANRDKLFGGNAAAQNPEEKQQQSSHPRADASPTQASAETGNPPRISKSAEVLAKYNVKPSNSIALKYAPRPNESYSL